MHNTLEEKSIMRNNSLFIDLKTLIESTKHQIIYYANSELVLLYWKIGERIQKDIIKSKRAIPRRIVGNIIIP